MSTDSQAVVDAALRLPDAERMMVVERLLDSLSPEETQVFDDEWEKELEERIRDFEKSPGDVVPWSELSATR